MGDGSFYGYFDIKNEFADAPTWAFMLLELHPGALESVTGCKLRYRPEFKDV